MLSFSKVLEPQFSISQIFENKVIYFTGNEYQRIFIPYFLKKLQIYNHININFINVDNIDINMIKSLLEMSFLGMKSYFWLGNLSEIADKKRKEILSYLVSYSGNNIIFVFVDQDLINEKSHFIVHCDYVLNFEQLKNIVMFFNSEIPKNTFYSLEKLFKNFNQIGLDQAYVLHQYATLIGAKTEEFTKNWINKIFVFEESLFILSKFFFSKDSKAFYTCLDKISKEYQSVFWASFWSEQLFRAWVFLNFKMLKNEVEAKRIAYKLPFSFINYDWKKSSILELGNAHQTIYRLDFSLKNGCSDVSFDLFYAKFFSGDFNK